MSDSALRFRNRGAYSNPFSGVGVEFYPLGVPADHSGFVLHEAGYLAANDWWDFPNVLSPFWRLYYNFRRGHKVIFPQGEVELTPEHIVVIPDRQLFHCQGGRPVPNLWLAFNVTRRLSPGQPIPIVVRPTPAERRLLRDFARLFAGDAKGTGPCFRTDVCRQDASSGRKIDQSPEASEQSRNRIFHAGMALLHVVLSRPEIGWQQSVPAAVVHTVAAIEKHYAEPLTVPRLARLANLCTEALARSFKRHQGETIGRFIMKVRVREAAHLLAHTDARIEEIAERTGFPNRAYLSRVFKRVTGESPAEFRRRHGG